MTYQVVRPLPGFEDQDLFDDCPICQEMKKQIELGNLERVQDSPFPAYLEVERPNRPYQS